MSTLDPTSQAIGALTAQVADMRGDITDMRGDLSGMNTKLDSLIAKDNQRTGAVTFAKTIHGLVSGFAGALLATAAAFFGTGHVPLR